MELRHFINGVPTEFIEWTDLEIVERWIGNFPPSKTHTVSGIEYNHNSNQPLPEIIGEWFDMNALEIVGYRLGDCTCKSPKLTWYHFKRVQKFNDTRHPKTKVRVVTVLAWTEKEYDAPTLLICKIK